jgi:flagellar motility protein MotE (MotC chaperone)
MRTLWNVVSFLAIVHLLAGLMLAGWLWHSRRLDGDRIMQVRALLAEPVTDEAAPGDASGDDDPDAIDGVQTAAALPSGARVELSSMLREQMMQSVRWLEDEKRLLTAQLERATAQVEQQQQAFTDRQAQWEQSIEAQRQRRIDEQFGKVVRNLESVPPKQAQRILSTLVAEGRPEQAVAYIDAMNPRAAAKVLREFKSDEDTVLATELLERLRTFGLEAEVTEDDGNDASPSNPAP